MLWFYTHEWKRSVNGMRPALTAESAGRRCQQVTLSLLSRPNVFDVARIQMHRSQLRPCRYRIGWPLKDVAHFQKAILHIVRGKEWRTPEPTDLIFPKWQSELFKTILEEENLRSDRDGRPRTAYSLRHTYISMRLMVGANIYQIAKNCRTSVGMIEKYYGVHVKNSLNAASINVVRSGKDVMAEEEEVEATSQPSASGF